MGKASKRLGTKKNLHTHIYSEKRGERVREESKVHPANECRIICYRAARIFIIIIIAIAIILYMKEVLPTSQYMRRAHRVPNENYVNLSGVLFVCFFFCHRRCYRVASRIIKI